MVSNASASALKTSIGDLLFKDLNGDGIINSEDRDYLGSGLPKYTFGWNNTFTYKRWSLSVFMYGSVATRCSTGNAARWTSLHSLAAPLQTSSHA